MTPNDRKVFLIVAGMAGVAFGYTVVSIVGSLIGLGR